MVKHGFTVSELSSIPDPESEHHFTSAAFKARFNTQINKPIKKTGNLQATKQKCTHDNNTIADHHVHLNPDFYVRPTNQLKHVQIDAIHDDSTSGLVQPPPTGGCSWSSIDWSCAYDCTIMVLLYAYTAATEERRLDWKHTGLAVTNHLTDNLDQVLHTTTIASSSERLHFAREGMRDLLSAQDPIMFPRHGQIGTPVERIFEVTTLNDPQFLTQFECPGSPPCTTAFISQRTRHLSFLLSSNLWEVLDGMHLPESHTASVQDWVNLSLYSYHPENTVMELTCENPCTEIQYGIPFISTPCPIIVFEITPGMTPSTVPNRILNIPDVDNEIRNYHLRGIIYYGGYHFTARLIDTHDIVWTYDSQIHNGLPQFDENFPSLNNVHDL